MKQKILALMAIVMMMLCSQTAKADNVMYTIFNSAEKTLTFYYGDKPDAGENETVFDFPQSKTEMPNWVKVSNTPLQIETVVFDSSFNEARPTSCYMWFYFFRYLKKIEGLEYLHTDNVENMEFMFSTCFITTLDLSNFKTENVTKMNNMFQDCYYLENLVLSSFNTKEVTSMEHMFYNCEKLQTLDVRSFNTEKVTNMSGMFSGCSGLTSLTFGDNFNTALVENMSRMFFGCSGLTSLDVTKFNTEKVTNMYNMFSGCSGLETLNVTNFNTEKVTNMSSMFCDCSGLTDLDVSKFNTNIVIYMNNMFKGCSQLGTLNVTNFNTEKVKNMSGMFSGCSGVTSLDVSKFNTNIVTDMSYMFSGCSGLETLNVTNFNTEKVKNMSGMFSGCSKLTSLDLTSFNTGIVTNMGSMFSACSELKTIYVSESFTNSAVTSSTYMFSGCSSLVGAIPYNSSTTDNTYANYKTGYFKTYCKVGETKVDLCGEPLKCENLVLADGNDFITSLPFTATKVTYSRDLSASTSKWGTLCLPFEYTPAGFEAYQLTSLDNENSIITLEKIEGTIAKGTPVLFKKPEEGGINISETEARIVTLPAEGTATEVGNLKLVGTYQAKTFTNADNNCFILKSDKLMNTAKILANTNVTKVGLNAYRAYMVNETTSSEAPQAYSIETGDGTTVINSLNIMTGEGAEYYDINGCRTDGLKKGLNIVRQGNKTMKIIIK